MSLTYIILLFVSIIGLVHGYDLDADLARGLVYNDSIILGVNLNDGRHLSDYPEDCAAIYLNAKALNQHVQSGIYEIWPREGIFSCHHFFVMCSILFMYYDR